LLDVARASSSVITACGRAWFAFSPAGDQAICADPGASDTSYFAQSFRLIGVATASPIRSINTSVLPRALLWTAGALLLAGLLDTDPNTLAVKDLLNGSSRVVYRLPPPSSSAQSAGYFGHGLAMFSTKFSPDGGRLAFWAAECTALSFDPGYCARTSGVLIVLDLHDGSPRVVASAELYDGSGAGPIAFSNDGAQLAYQIGTGIHVRPLPP